MVFSGEINQKEHFDNWNILYSDQLSDNNNISGSWYFAMSDNTISDSFN